MIDLADRLMHHSKKRYKERKAENITQIVLHHSATKPNTLDGMRDVYAFAEYHVRELGWPGIGYHYVVAPDGTIYKTQANTTVSYHASGANAYSLGVCMIGFFDKGDVPKEQREAALKLIRELMGAYNIPADKVIGHREVPAPKSCPGTRVNMDTFRKELN